MRRRLLNACVRTVQPLRQAADFYLRNIKIIQCQKTVDTVFAELLEIKAKDESSARYIKDLRHKLETFLRDPLFQTRAIHEITRDELVTWLYSLDVAAVTRKNYARSLSVLFTYALDKHYCVSHPAQKLVPEKANDKKPGILTVTEAKALLLAADPDFIPGLRSGYLPVCDPSRKFGAWIGDRLNCTNESSILTGVKTR